MRMIAFKNGVEIELTDKMVLDFIGVCNGSEFVAEVCHERLLDIYQHEKLAYKGVETYEYFDKIKMVAIDYTKLEWEM